MNAPIRSTRRNLLWLAGGATAGLALTPVPWKLLDDVAIWTQNGSWVPPLPKGEITTKFSACTLCPAGCGVRAKCVGGRPVYLAGAAAHPANHGGLCATGVAAHHLAWHPARVNAPLRAGAPTNLDWIIAEIGRAIQARPSSETVLFLDESPGRATSLLYRRLASALDSTVYAAFPGSQFAALETLGRLIQEPTGAYGPDLENTRLVVSFGTPLVEDWSAPGRVMRAREFFRLIQIEPRCSRTASMADEWIALKPGTEVAVALAIANVLLRERLYQHSARRAPDFDCFQNLAAQYTPEFVGKLAAIPPDTIATLARQLAGTRPAVVLAGGDPAAGRLGLEEEIVIGAINLLIGAVGIRGGLLLRREMPAPNDASLSPVRSLDDVPDRSVRVLVTDAAAPPWPAVRRKLTRDATVVALTSHRTGLALHAGYVVPVPAPFEAMTDALAAGSPVARYSVAPALSAPPHGVSDPSAFLASLAVVCGVPPPGSVEDVIRQRAAAIHASRRGTLFSYSDGATAAVKDIEQEQFVETLIAGACWTDEQAEPAPPTRFTMLAGWRERIEAVARGRFRPAPQFPLVLLPHGQGEGPAPVTLSKLYQESDLRAMRQAAISPETAASGGLNDGARAVVETTCGSCEVTVRVDPSVMPGVLEIASAPVFGETAAARIAEICDSRVTPARARRTS
jgi:hypothetical protein